MNDISNNRYFVLLKKKKISFQVLDSMNIVIFKKEALIENYSIDNIYFLTEKFLNKNIFEIEKNLKSFIKEIYIIFESDFFFEAGSSIKYTIQKTNFIYDNINDILLEMKNQFKKFSSRNEIIHMVVDKYILDGYTYETLPEIDHNKNLVIQANFICLNEEITKNFKKIFSKYQISVNKILSYNFLKSVVSEENNNILKLANDSINGLIKNEILIINKISKNPGFFERFFNFFN